MSDKGQVEACYRQMYRDMVEIDAAVFLNYNEVQEYLP